MPRMTGKGWVGSPPGRSDFLTDATPCLAGYSSICSLFQVTLAKAWLTWLEIDANDNLHRLRRLWISLPAVSSIKRVCFCCAVEPFVEIIPTYIRVLHFAMPATLSALPGIYGLVFACQFVNRQ